MVKENETQKHFLFLGERDSCNENHYIVLILINMLELQFNKNSTENCNQFFGIYATHY
jgi:hypothetical protein